MNIQSYLHELEMMNEIDISKWHYISIAMLDACTRDSTRCFQLIKCISSISEPMGSYIEDLFNAFEESNVQRDVIEQIRSSRCPDEVTEIISTIEVGPRSHLRAIIFFGVIVCLHIEAFEMQTIL